MVKFVYKNCYLFGLKRGYFTTVSFSEISFSISFMDTEIFLLIFVQFV
ncbi:hypothetical protein M085_0556 [Bacteroides fragilis str. 3986 N(B)19]|nr:hypothetical protein M085_0556 [Bacteroides fragilis str. 3986 N(B)19]